MPSAEGFLKGGDIGIFALTVIVVGISGCDYFEMSHLRAGLEVHRIRRRPEGKVKRHVAMAFLCFAPLYFPVYSVVS